MTCNKQLGVNYETENVTTIAKRKLIESVGSRNLCM